MMLFTNSLQVLVLLVIWVQVQAVTKCIVSSRSGIALPGHVIKSYHCSSFHNCYIECKRNPVCRSINYFLQQLLCQHNRLKISDKPEDEIKDIWATYIDNPDATGNVSELQTTASLPVTTKLPSTAPRITFTTSDGWTLIARFSNSDTKNWMDITGAWWYDVTTAQGNVTSTTVNQDMISTAFWTFKGQEIKITRTDDPTHTALLTTNSNCLGGQTFRAKLTSYGNFRNGVVWASSKCLGSCQVTYGGNYATTVGFKYANCDSNIQTKNKVGFWCDYGSGDGAVMMIGGGGSGCNRADHGIGVTEENAAQFKVTMGFDFGDNASKQTTPYALNLWIK